MRVLVTGGTGYIGSHTAVALLRQGHDVCLVDNFANSSDEVVPRIAQLANADVSCEQGDITDAPRMTEICRAFRPEAVIHFAGLKAVGESEENPLKYYDDNVAGTITLLKVLDEVGCGKIVFSSSATVYGDADYLPYDEAHRLAPVNPYGRTKYFIEQIISDWVSASGSLGGKPQKGAMLLRYFNPVGADPTGLIGENPLGVPNNLVPYIAQVAVGRRPALTIFGDDYDTIDGTGVRDYIHVSDLAMGHIAALMYLAGHDGVEAVNLGTGKGHSVQEVVAEFRQVSGHDIPTIIAPRRAGDVAASYADTAKARSLLGWQAEKSLHDMCADVWRWQSANPNGYEGA